MLASYLRIPFAFAFLFVYGAIASAEPSEATRLTHFRASHLIGMSVQNLAREEIGKINDFVFDNKTGQIRYVAISFGSTFGFGGKLFAVPYKEVEIRYDPEKETHFVMFQVKKEQLENAPGFDSVKWPNFGDAKWTGTNDKFWEVLRESKK